MFLGYSLRDDTVKDVLAEIGAVLGGKLPPSYLVAYTWTPELEAACRALGVEVIDPSQLYRDTKSKGAALDRFLADLTRETVKKKVAEDIRMHFDDDTPHSTAVVTRYDIEALAASLPSLDVSEGCAKFRATFDAVIIPQDLQGDVAGVLVELCRRCSTKEDSTALSAALFNLQLTESKHLLKVVAAVMATGNVRPKPDLLDMFHIVGPAGELASIFTAAIAIDILISEWSRPIQEAFLHYVSDWSDRGTELDTLREDAQVYTRHWIDQGWKVTTVLENPVARQKRLKGKYRFKGPSFNEIVRSIDDSMPKRFKKPYED